MASILQLKNRLEAIDSNTVAVQCLEENEENLVEHNQAQMYSGLNKDGSEITPSYTPLTKFLKQEKGQPHDRVTLYDTGSYYAKMYANVSGNAIKYGSTDSKAQKIEKKYGTEIYGLSTPFRTNVVQRHLKPSFIRIIKQVTGL